MRIVADLEDMKQAARGVLPRPLFDWIEGGSFRERTMIANERDFAKWHFCQRSLVDVSTRSAAVEIVGQSASMPVVISPTGLSGVLWLRDGEINVAKAARAADIPFCLAMLSVVPLEEVVAAAGPVWVQIAMLKRRELIRQLIERADAAGCPVLVMTTTMPVGSRLNRSIRNELYALPPRLSPRNLFDYGRRTGWLWRTFSGRRVTLGNFEGHFTPGKELVEFIDQVDDGATWKDLEWVRSLWPRKLIVKGIMNPEDARRAVACGADAVSVSNHGGIQLDDADSTVDMLPRILDAVDGRAEVLLDGGIRSGQDVLKAVALGAKGCLIGRAHLYGLAAAGEAGVRQILDIFRNEIDVTMALTGTTDLRNQPMQMLRLPEGNDLC